MPVTFSVEETGARSSHGDAIDDDRSLSKAVTHVVSFAEALDRFSRSLDTEAAIRSDDIGPVRASLLRSQQVLSDTAARMDRPGGSAPVTSPVFVIGFLRTGSTLVHNLLGLHERLYAPRLWELAQPVETAETADTTDAPDRRRALREAAQDYVEDYYRKAPGLPAVHFLDAGLPDECHRLLANTFHSMVLEMRYRVPSYGEWLHHQDLTEAYRWHRHQLSVLLAAHRRADGTAPVPVLKCPFHTWFLPALVRVYPDARFIHLHRDPSAVVVSTASLCRIVRGARSDSVDDQAIGALWHRRIRELSSSLADDRDELLAHRPVLDVRYDDLVADPVTALERIGRFLELPVDPAYLVAVADHLDAHPAGRHGTHRYQPDDFGLSTERIAAATTTYRRRFGV